MRSSFINIPDPFKLGDLLSMSYLWSYNLLWHWSTYLYFQLFFPTSLLLWCKLFHFVIYFLVLLLLLLVCLHLVVLLYKKLWGSRWLFCYALDPNFINLFISSFMGLISNLFFKLIRVKLLDIFSCSSLILSLMLRFA
jgi:hypothetical protein